MHPRLRLGLVLLPVLLLAGCGPHPSFNFPVERGGAGTVTIVDPPSTATPGSTLKLDLTGSTLPGHCIYSVSTILAGDAAWAGRWEDNAQNSVLFKPTTACETFRGTIDVPIAEGFRGDTLTVKISSRARNATRLTRYTAQADLALTAAATAPAANAAPTARLFARNLRVSSEAADSRLLDARLSTDLEGQPLTYTWDTNGDGVHGDPVESTDALGVVRLPTALVAGQGYGRKLRISVKATDSLGLSATAATEIEIIEPAMYTAVGAQSLEFLPATGTVGTAATVSVRGTATGQVGCIDANADGRYDDGIVDTARDWGFTFTPAVPGANRVGIAFWAGGQNDACADATASYSASQVLIGLFDAAAPRSSHATVKGYRAKARFTLGGATMVALGDLDADGTLRGTAGRGTYTLRTPAKGNGSNRPSALTLFPKGHYVVRAASLGFFGAARTQTVIGQSTMLLRGTRGALVCLAVTATPTGSTYVFAGGTGAAARLTGDATSTRIQVRPNSARPPKSGTQSFKGKRQQRPIGSNATIAVATAKATPLPADCAALKRYLP